MTFSWELDRLSRFGLPVICIDARHAKAVLKMQINKSDRNDAAGIARIMQTGWFKEVRVKDLDSHSVRALLAPHVSIRSGQRAADPCAKMVRAEGVGDEACQAQWAPQS
jgi:transposase